MKIKIILSIIILLPIFLMSYPITMSVGGRAGAMGGAFTAISDDALAIYYNPGGLTNLNNSELTFMYQKYRLIESISTSWVSVAYPINENIGIGAGWLNKYATLESGISYNSIDTTSISDNYFSFGAAFKVLKHISLGLSAQRYVLYSDIDDKSGFGMNSGILAKLGKLPFTVGFAVYNITAGMSEEGYTPEYRLGIAYKGLPLYQESIIEKIVDGKKKKYLIKKQKGYQLAISADVMYKQNVINLVTEKSNLIHYYIGMEYTPIEFFSIRIGYNDVDKFTGGVRAGYNNYFVDITYMMGKNDPVLNIPIMGPSYQVALTLKL